MAAPAWLRTTVRLLLLPLKIVLAALIAIVLFAIVTITGAIYLVLRLLIRKKREVTGPSGTPVTPAASGRSATVIDIAAEQVAAPVVLPQAPRPARWSMPDADPFASRSLDAAGPRHGKLLWSVDTGPEVEGLVQPTEAADGSILTAAWWVKGDHGPRMFTIDPSSGAVTRETATGGWVHHAPVTADDGIIYSVAGETLEASDAAGRQLWSTSLPRQPFVMRFSPNRELWLFIASSGFYGYTTAGQLVRKLPPSSDAWSNGYFACDAAGNFYTAEDDHWRGGPDEEAERFSRVSCYGAGGFRRWQHNLTAPSSTDDPYNQVRDVWGLAEAAVFFGQPRIQCYDAAGAAVWEIANERELSESPAELPEIGVTIGRDPRLAGAPVLVNLVRGWLDYIECATDRDGNAYFAVPHHAVSIDATGRLRWSVRLPAEHLYHPMLTTGGLLVVTGGGNLYAIG